MGKKKNYEKPSQEEYAKLLAEAHNVVQSRNENCKGEFVVISPAEAEKFLANNNIRNRKKSTGTASSYATQMYKGEWKVNGEPIIFSEPVIINGVPTEILMDGQHRLAACVMSGRPLPTYMIKGIPFDDMETVDTGKTRTGKDVLSAAQVYEDDDFTSTEYSRASSIIKKVLEYTSGRLASHGHPATRPAPTNANVVADAIENSEMYVAVTRKVLELGNDGIKTLAYMNKTAMNFVGYYMAWLLRNFGYSKQEVFPFFEKLVDSTYNGGENDPIMALRSIFRQKFDKNIAASTRKGYGELDLYDFFARAWNSYVLGEKRGKMSARSIGTDSEKCVKPLEKCEVEAKLAVAKESKKNKYELELVASMSMA